MVETKFSLDANIELQTLVGESICLKVQEINWDDEIPSCLMLGIVEPEQWPRIWEENLFQLSPKAILQDVVEFEEEGLITLELALDGTILQSLLNSTDPIETFLYGLGGTTEESAVLLRSDSWQAHSVMQAIGVPSDPDATLQIGFQTIWAKREA